MLLIHTTSGSPVVGRTSYGQFSQHQNFLDALTTKFSYPWCTAMNLLCVGIKTYPMRKASLAKYIVAGIGNVSILSIFIYHAELLLSLR